jgi:hypothetical protein
VSPKPSRDTTDVTNEEQPPKPHTRILVAETGHYQFTIHPPTFVTASTNPDAGDASIKVNAPEISSEAQRMTYATVALRVQGRPDVGARGEAQVMKTLRARLLQSEIKSVTLSGNDDRGEDRVLQLPNRKLIVQSSPQRLDARTASSQPNDKPRLSSEKWCNSAPRFRKELRASKDARWRSSLRPDRFGGVSPPRNHRRSH